MQLTQGKGPSRTVDSGRKPVCFILRGTEEVRAECVLVSSPVTNAVSCFDFTRWTGDFSAHIEQNHTTLGSGAGSLRSQCLC